MQVANSSKLDLTKQHLQILEYTDSLFTRWSLRRNTYLFKHLKPNLQLPLFILAQQRRIAQITQSQSTLVEALKLSQFVQLSQDNRTVRIRQLPTVRLQDQPTLLKTQKLLKQHIKTNTLQDKTNSTKPLQYITSSKTEQSTYYLTLKQKNPSNKNLLKDLINQYNKNNGEKILYTCQPLYDDVKDGIGKLRKSKRDGATGHQYGAYQGKYNGGKALVESQIGTPVYSRQNMMMMMYPGMYYSMYGGMMPEQAQIYMQQQQGNKTYGIFIRKAVDSDEQQQIQKTEQPQLPKSQPQPQSQPTTQQPNITTSNTTQKQPQQHPQQNTNTNTKKYESKQNEQKPKKQDKKHNKNKVVLDDNDFPSIG